MMNKQYLKDTLAYVRYIHNDTNKSDRAKYLALISTLGHDLNGVINEEHCFRPRVSGYAKLEEDLLEHQLA
jgi:hypothetical protein